MAVAAFSIRMDQKLKDQFAEVCDSFGMSISTLFNVFARTVVRERCIPFQIKADTPPSGVLLFRKIREQALAANPDGMTLDEINQEIDNARRGIGE